jgi:hypothetical protein
VKNAAIALPLFPTQYPPLLPAGLAAAVQKRDRPVALGLGGDVARDGMTGHRTGIGGRGARISFHG